MPPQELSDLVIKVGNEEYTITRRAQKNYCRLYRVKIHPLDSEEREHLQTEVKAYLDKKESDLIFRIEDHTITRIEYRPVTPENKTPEREVPSPPADPPDEDDF